MISIDPTTSEAPDRMEGIPWTMGLHELLTIKNYTKKTKKDK